METLGRDPAYLDWIRHQPCCVSQRKDTVIAHHIQTNSSRGLGQKPSDYWSVPLTNHLHMELHTIGEKSFWRQRLGIDEPHSLAAIYLTRYLTVEKGNGLELLRVINDFASEKYSATSGR